MAFYDFISFFELKLSWDISTHDPGSCLDLFHSGKKEESLKCTREKIPEFFGLSRRRRIVTRRSSTLATFIGGGGGCKVLRLN